jgi:hypothetical protein
VEEKALKRVHAAGGQERTEGNLQAVRMEVQEMRSQKRFYRVTHSPLTTLLNV